MRWTRPCSFPACRMPGLCRSRRASTCWRPASARPLASRFWARTSRSSRSSPAISREVLVPLANGASVPLGQVANVKLVQGPASIRTENAQLAAYIFVDARDRDLGGYVADARAAVAEKVTFPSGYYAIWSGQFE